LVAIIDENEILSRFGLSDINSFYELEYSMGPSMLRDELMKFDFCSFYGSFKEVHKVANITIGSDFMGKVYVRLEEVEEEGDSLF